MSVTTSDADTVTDAIGSLYCVLWVTAPGGAALTTGFAFVTEAMELVFDSALSPSATLIDTVELAGPLLNVQSKDPLPVDAVNVGFESAPFRPQVRLLIVNDSPGSASLVAKVYWVATPSGAELGPLRRTLGGEFVDEHRVGRCPARGGAIGGRDRDGDGVALAPLPATERSSVEVLPPTGLPFFIQL